MWYRIIEKRIRRAGGVYILVHFWHNHDDMTSGLPADIVEDFEIGWITGTATRNTGTDDDPVFETYSPDVDAQVRGVIRRYLARRGERARDASMSVKRKEERTTTDDPESLLDRITVHEDEITEAT